MARVSYIDTAQATGDARAMLSQMQERGREIINLHRIIAHSPNLLRNFFRLGNSLLVYGLLPPVLRELAIMRVAQLTGADYEWAHHVPIAKQAGVSDAQIERLREWQKADVFNARERAVLAFVDAITATRDVPDDVFEAASAQLNENEVVELTIVCGYWGMAAAMLNTLRLDVEPPFQQYLPSRSE